MPKGKTKKPTAAERSAEERRVEREKQLEAAKTTSLSRSELVELVTFRSTRIKALVEDVESRTGQKTGITISDAKVEDAWDRKVLERIAIDQSQTIVSLEHDLANAPPKGPITPRPKPEKRDR